MFFLSFVFIGWFSKSLGLILKCTKVTTEHQQWPNMDQNSIKSPFFAHKKASGEGWSSPQELEELQVFTQILGWTFSKKCQLPSSYGYGVKVSVKFLVCYSLHLWVLPAAGLPAAAAAAAGQPGVQLPILPGAVYREAIHLPRERHGWATGHWSLVNNGHILLFQRGESTSTLRSPGSICFFTSYLVTEWVEVIEISTNTLRSFFYSVISIIHRTSPTPKE